LSPTNTGLSLRDGAVEERGRDKSRVYTLQCLTEKAE
jgi:hypothetical protein